MSLNVTFNGSMYIIPETGEVGWGGNTTSYLVAIAAGALQKTGGSFTLSAETDFGASFGLKSLYYKSRSANIAAAGILRLNNNSDSINWRNAANTGDLLLLVNASDQLLYNGSPVLTGTGPSSYVSSITGTANQVIASASTGAVTLSLPQSINTTANVQFGTLGLGSSIVASSILSLTSTTLGFLPPRLTTTERDAIVSPATGLFIYNTTTGVNNYYNGTLWVAIAAGGTINAGLQYQLSYYATNGTTLSGLTLITGSRALASDINGLPVASVTTAAELAFVSGVTSAIQTQINTKAPSANPTFTGVALFADGTAALPSLSFSSDPNTGIFWRSADSFGFTAGGALRVTINTTGLSIDSGTIQLLDGTAGSPALQFGTDLDTGIYKNGSNDLGITAGGVVIADFLFDGVDKYVTAATTRLQWGDGTAALPSYSFSSDTNSGIFWRSADSFGFSAGGVLRATLNTTGFSIDSGTLQVLDGSVSSPSLAFGADLNTGIYRIGTDDIGITTNGTTGLEVTATQQVLLGPTTGDGSASVPLIRFGSRNSGFYTDSTSDINISVNGTNVAVIGPSASLWPDGTVSLPGVSFTSDTDNGLYRVGTNNPALAAGGTKVVDMKTTGVAVLGTTTNDNAASGFIGEYVESNVTTNQSFSATGTIFDGTSISLTAGDWDITASADYSSSTNTVSTADIGISTTTGNSATGLTFGTNRFESTPPNLTYNSFGVVSSYRQSLSGTTTVYLKLVSTFTGTAPQYRCSLRARRAR